MASSLSSQQQHPKDNVAADASFLEAMPVVELHRSNVLRLETEQLLQECRLDVPAWHASAQEYLSNLNQVLQTIIRNVDTESSSCPFPLQADKAPTSLRLPSPLSMEWNAPVGMTTRAGNAKQVPLLECSIVLPNGLFASKDYLNHRYFHKRSLTLWHIAQHFDKADSRRVGRVQWRYASGDRQTPCLVFTPPIAETPKRKAKKQKKTANTHWLLPLKRVKFQLEIRLKMESLDWIPSPRLFPNRSNLHSIHGSTPCYNAALGRDACNHVEFDWNELPTNLQDALVLLKVWCLQRGFLEGHDSFRSLENVAVLLLYLVRTKHVTARMAPLQILTVWFKFVAQHEWLREKQRVALVLPRDNITTEAQTIQQCPQAQLYARLVREESSNYSMDPPTLLECFQKYTDGPILLSSDMKVNLWGHVSPSFVRHVQLAAASSLECLHSNSISRPFSTLFMEPCRFHHVMDAVMCIPLSLLNDVENGFDGVARKVVEKLHQALGDRVRLIRVLTTGNGRIDATDNNSPNQIPIHDITSSNSTDNNRVVSPLGDDNLVLGFVLNSETCHRVVDRGPPAENVEATRAFLNLWGDKRAQLRRFKDGAIVHAVVWNTPDDSSFEGDEKSQGGIVERIVWHIIHLHFCNSKAPKKRPQFALGNVVSLVDGVTVASGAASPQDKLLTSSTTAHRSILNAFDSLSEFLRQHSSPTIPVPGSTDAKTSRLGVPLAIDAVEPLSPCLRYSELFPPIPHPSLGGGSVGAKKLSGVAPTPILIQIRFGLSSKWPTDLKAMGAAKTAMLIQLADGIEEISAHGFDGPIQVTPDYMNLGYKGYSWRIVVRADPELHMLRKLQKPTPEAVSLLHTLTRDHVVSAMHHSMIHGIHTSHPSSGSVVRLAKRWTACHLLSDLIPFEAIELLIAKVYTNRDVPLDPPTTVVSGFLRFLRLLSCHDWTRHPLVVNPHGHMTEDDHSDIVSQFEHVRGPEFNNGPPMYIISPNDRGSQDEDDEEEPKKMTAAVKKTSTWIPAFTQHNPERVVLARAVALAKRSYDFLFEALSNDKEVDWSVVFHESPSSFKSFSALFRVDPDFVIDKECSSTASDVSVRCSNEGVPESSYTRSMRQRSMGPKALRRKVYRNLSNSEDDVVLHGWRPVEDLVQSLREKFGSLALFFYNDLTPEVIGVLWRPTSFVPQPFSVMHSEFARPMEDESWKSDSLVIHNQEDILREMSQYTEGIVANIKVLDDRSIQARSIMKKRSVPESSSEESSSDSE